MTATERLRELLDERGVGSYTHEAPAAVCLAFFDGKRWHDCWESVGGEVNVTFSMTPEQAIAATLGSKPEETELTQAYDAGFRNGVMAVFQQLEGVEDYEGLQELIAEYWGEGEGNDER